MGSKLPKHREQRQMESFFCYYLEKCGRKLVFLCNLKQKDAAQLKIKDPFFKRPCRILVQLKL